MKQKFLALLLTLVTVMAFILPHSTAYAEVVTDLWDGTSDTSWYDSENVKSIYDITTAEQLAGLAELVNSSKNFKDVTFNLKSNINLAGKEWTPIGKFNQFWYAEVPFEGVFNGNGSKISGLYINDDTRTNSGLFGYVGTNGVIKNLNVEGSVLSEQFVGGIAGTNKGTIEKCSFAGSVKGSGILPEYIGGIAGENQGTIRKCVNTAVVEGGECVGGIAGCSTAYNEISECYNIGDVSGSNAVGGILGKSGYQASVNNCYSTGTVSGIGNSSQNIGGVVGSNSGRVNNCYNIGTVSGAGDSSQNIGGVIGLDEQNVVNVHNCFFLNGKAVTGVGNGKYTVKAITEDELAAKKTFTDAEWDFDMVWDFTLTKAKRPLLKANTEKIEFSVTLITNGGTVKSGNVTSYYNGTGAALPTDVKKEGFTFRGWHEKEDLSDAKVSAIDKMARGDKTYYAEWSVATYTVTYKYGENTQSFTKTHNVPFKLQGSIFTLPDNFIQIGWKTLDGSSDYDLEETFEENRDITLYPKLDKIVTVNIPYTTIVEQGGDVTPEKADFSLEAAHVNTAEELYPDVTFSAGLSTNGKGSYNGNIAITGPSRQIKNYLCGGIFIRQIKGDQANWTYSDEIWALVLDTEVSEETEEYDNISVIMYPASMQAVGEEVYYEFNRNSSSSDKITFTNIYTLNLPADDVPAQAPTDCTDYTDCTATTAATAAEHTPDASPITGDDADLNLWMLLTIISLAVATALYAKKQS